MRLHCCLTFLFLCSTSILAADFNVRNFGAVGDGLTDDTQAIRKAAAAAEFAKGGRLIFDEGYRFLTGCFNISSNIILDVRGTILGSQKSDAYELVEPVPWYGVQEGSGPLIRQALIRSTNAFNITITGGGLIDGQGEPWWWCLRNDSTMSKPPCLGLARPNLIRLMNTVGIKVHDITFKDSPAWNLHLANTTNVHVHDISIVATNYSHNTDGVDIDCSVNVLVENYFYNGNDDAIAVKSGIDEYGRTTENVLVRNTTVGQPGFVENVTYSDFYLKDIGYGGAIQVQMDWNPKLPVGNATTTPIFKNIRIENLIAEEPVDGIMLNGLPESPIQGIELYNISITGAKKYFMWGCQDTYGFCDNSTVVPYCPTCIQEQCLDAIDNCQQYINQCSQSIYHQTLCGMCRKTCILCDSC